MIISWSYYYYFDTLEVITKIQHTSHHGASAMMRAAAGPSRSSDWLIDWLIDWSIYFLHFIRSFHSSKAILRSSSVQDKKVKTDNPNVNNNSKQLALAARSYQIILRRPSIVVIDVGPLRKVRGGHFWNIRHGESLAVPSLLWLWMKNDFCKKEIMRGQMGRSSMADPERGLWEAPNFKEVPKFWKLIGFRLPTT